MKFAYSEKLNFFCLGKNFKKYSHKFFLCLSILTITFMIVDHLVEQCFKTYHATTSATSCMFQVFPSCRRIFKEKNANHMHIDQYP